MGTWAMTSPVAGLYTGSVLSVFACTHSPPIKFFSVWTVVSLMTKFLLLRFCIKVDSFPFPKYSLEMQLSIMTLSMTYIDPHLIVLFFLLQLPLQLSSAL